MAIGGFDQPLNLGAIQSFHRPAAFAWRCQPQLMTRLFDNVFGLVISQVVFAPKLGCLTGDIPQGVRFLLLTANFMAPGTGFAAWHAPAYARKFGVCSFCEQRPGSIILIYEEGLAPG